MIITITGREQAFTKNGAEYLKVTGVDGTGKETTKSVFDHFKDKWEALQPNTTWEFVMEKKGQFWNVAAIKPIAQTVKEAGIYPEQTEKPKDHLVQEAKKMGAVEEKMSKQDWNDKDAVTRRSIERQKSADLAVQMKISGNDKTFAELADAIYHWISKKGNEKE